MPGSNSKQGGKPSDAQGDGKLKLHKCRMLNIRIQFKESGFTENYDMKINTGISVAELKGDIELLTGIPTMLQQVCFNDEAILYDTTFLHELNLVNSCTLSLTVRHDWAKLVEAVLQQDLDKILALGVTESSDFHSPSIDYIKDPERRKEAIRFRGTVALIIASHRGMARVVRELIAAGIDVNGQTQFKRSSLHIVAAKGQSEILDILIHNGANIDLLDYNNETPLDIANRLEQQQSSRQLFLFRWQLRAKNAQPQFADVPMFPHQYFDSDLTIHFNGSQGQVYMLHVPPPGESDRWKPRKNPEIVRIITRPTTSVDTIQTSETTEKQAVAAAAAAAGASGKAPKSTATITASEFLSKSSFGIKKARPKSPAFAYEDGVAPVGNKKEGKKTFEEWLAEKKNGVSKTSSVFGSREGQRPARPGTTPSTSSRLMSSLQDRLNSSSHTSKSVDFSSRQLFGRSEPLHPHSAYSQHGRSHQITHYNSTPSSVPVSTQSPTEFTTEHEVRQQQYFRPLTSTCIIPAVFGPVHDFVYKYQRVRSAADTWIRPDRDKSGFTALWT